MKKAVRRLTLKKIDRTESTDSPFSTNIPGGDGSEHPKSLSARSASNGPHVEWKHVKADQIRSRNQEEDSELSLQTNESSSSSSSSFSSRSFKRRTSKGEDFLKFAKRQSSGGIVTRSRANTTITSPIQPTSHSRSPRARHKSQRQPRPGSSSVIGQTGLPSPRPGEMKNSMQTPTHADSEMTLLQKLYWAQHRKSELEACLYWLGMDLSPSLRIYIYFIPQIVKIQRWFRRLSEQRKQPVAKCFPVIDLKKATPFLLLTLDQMTEDQRLRRTRYNAAMAIVEAQRNYCASMDALQFHFAQPLRDTVIHSHSRLITEKDHELIFGGLPNVRLLANQLLSALESKQATILEDELGGSHCGGKWVIGDVFVSFLPRFADFKRACVDQREASEILEVLMKKTEFRDKIHDLTNSTSVVVLGSTPPFLELFKKQGDHLGDLKKLLTELEKNTERDHPDRHFIRASLLSISELLLTFENISTELADRRELEKLQHRLIDYNIVKPGRHIISSGRLRVVEKNRSSDAKAPPFIFWKAEVFVFNDDVLLAAHDQKGIRLVKDKEKKEKLVVRKVFPLSDIAGCGDPLEFMNKFPNENVRQWTRDEEGSRVGFAILLPNEILRFVASDSSSSSFWEQTFARLSPVLQDCLSLKSALESSELPQIPEESYPLQLTINIVEGRNLVFPKVFWVQPGVRVFFEVGGEENCTSAWEKSPKPKWSESLNFSVRSKDLLLKLRLNYLDMANEQEKFQEDFGSLSFPLSPFPLGTEFGDWMEIESSDNPKMALKIRIKLTSLSSTPSNPKDESQQSDLPKEEKASGIDDMINKMEMITGKTFDVPAPPGLLARCKPLEKMLSEQTNIAIQSEGTGLSKAVKPPKNCDPLEWQLYHMFKLIQICNQIYFAVQSVCTQEECPLMGASANVCYQWVDDSLGAIEVSAPEYFRLLNEWTSQQLANRVLFPMAGALPQSGFSQTIPGMAKKYVCIISHVYYRHWSLAKEKMGPLLTLATAYVYFFVVGNKLLRKDSDSSALAPLDNLAKQFRHLGNPFRENFLSSSNKTQDLQQINQEKIGKCPSLLQTNYY